MVPTEGQGDGLVPALGVARNWESCIPSNELRLVSSRSCCLSSGREASWYLPCVVAVSEEQCLYQIYIDELYGGLQKPNEDEKKK